MKYSLSLGPATVRLGVIRANKYQSARNHASDGSMLAHAHGIVRAQARGGARWTGRDGKNGDIKGSSKGTHMHTYLLSSACLLVFH